MGLIRAALGLFPTLFSDSSSASLINRDVWEEINGEDSLRAWKSAYSQTSHDSVISVQEFLYPQSNPAWPGSLDLVQFSVIHILGLFVKFGLSNRLKGNLFHCGNEFI